MVTQLIPRRMTQAELMDHGFVMREDGTYRHPQTGQRRVQCRQCGRWVPHTSNAGRNDVPNGYCRRCLRACQPVGARPAALSA
jgi:hypothetical protein